MAIHYRTEGLSCETAAITVGCLHCGVRHRGIADAVRGARHAAGALCAIGKENGTVLNVAVCYRAFAARCQSGRIYIFRLHIDVVEREIAQTTLLVDHAEHGRIAFACIDIETLDGVSVAVEMAGEVVCAVAYGSEVIAGHVNVGHQLQILAQIGTRIMNGVSFSC